VDYRIELYLARTGACPFGAWVRALADAKAKRAIYRRLARSEAGNFGDQAHCGAGVHELRVHVGPGYRVYFALVQRRVMLLLCGGAKVTQVKDIAHAHEYWRDFQARTNDRF